MTVHIKNAFDLYVHEQCQVITGKNKPDLHKPEEIRKDKIQT